MVSRQRNVASDDDDGVRAACSAASALPPWRTFAGRRDGKPDLQGFYVPDAGGANQGLEKRDGSSRTVTHGAGAE